MKEEKKLNPKENKVDVQLESPQKQKNGVINNVSNEPTTADDPIYGQLQKVLSKQNISEEDNNSIQNQDKVMDDPSIYMKDEFQEINQETDIVNEPIVDEQQPMSINDLVLTFGLEKESIQKQ